MKSEDRQIVLASSSRRRTSILSICRIPHKVMRPSVREEIEDGGEPRDVVLANAHKKALYISKLVSNSLVVGLDTVVYIDGKIIGKLTKKRVVRRMLRCYSGKTFSVHTGVVVIDTGKDITLTESVSTKVTMKKMGAARLNKWIDYLGPFDKAGGFSIEGPGALLFSSIDGCFYNVLGLPVSKLDDMFRELGYDLLDFIKK